MYVCMCECMCMCVNVCMCVSVCESVCVCVGQTLTSFSEYFKHLSREEILDRS